jgi:hypothetical protein
MRVADRARVGAMADAVVIPGRTSGPWAPLLMYSGDVAEYRGATVHRHSWSADSPDFTVPDIENWVGGEVSPILERIDGTPLLIGKSLGANAARLAALHSLPAVWLTPVLRFMPWVVAALEDASAPFLLVGGTADRSWDVDLAHRLTPHVLSVDGADHGMYVPGALQQSIDVLGRVVGAVEAFLDAISWPGCRPGGGT